MTSPSELVRALGPLVDELERLGVRHYVGGSVASSIHGAARSTLDVDVAAELDETAAPRLIGSLNDEYYISREAVLDAVRRRSCFNLIHLAISFKVDVFVSKGREFDRCVQDRAVSETIGDAGSLSAPVATAEDIILLKLERYRFAHFSAGLFSFEKARFSNSRNGKTPQEWTIPGPGTWERTPIRL